MSTATVNIQVPRKEDEDTRFTFKLPIPLHERLLAESDRQGVSGAELLRHIMDQVLPSDISKAA